MDMMEKTSLGDVWLKFEEPEDEEAEYEANTFYMVDLGMYVIEWYHTGVGQVMRVEFNTLEEAHTWYAENGFLDFSS